MIKLNLKYYEAVNEVFKRLNILRRWTSFTIEGKYNELAKQALNCVVAYILASYCENEGRTIMWERFPKIAIHRAFQKGYVYFDTPEHILNDIAKKGGIPKDAFNETTEQIMVEETDKEFVDFISEGINTFEMDIYKAATKVATLIELVENQSKIGTQKDYNKKMREILCNLKQYNFPGLEELQDTEGDLFNVLRNISNLRNQNRWSVMCYTVDCSVLGHLFDTAVYAYFCGLEKYGDEEMAAKMFFMGIFHDVAEAWTKDIPSPIKNRIPGFREATEKYELAMVEDHLYTKVPNFIADNIRKVMFEEDENTSFKKIMKGADYLSADSECWRFYMAGSRDKYFFKTAITNFQNDLDIGEKCELPPTAFELHRYFYEYAEGLNL